MKRILMVGAGSCQINAIKKIKEMGHYVIAADYNEWTEGKALADAHVMADAFDTQAIMKCAMSYDIDGIMTVGTDQPVLVVNQVAESLELPHFLDSETALWVTNKRAMKTRLSQFKIPTASYTFISRSFSSTAITGVKPPYVIKPIDSQGQRGIYKVDTIDEIRMRIDEVLMHSRSEEILVEQYYESTEVTVSGWVANGHAHIFTITDRVTFPADVRIGVCIAHQFPSMHQKNYGEKIEDITQSICNCFNIENGPIYFQLLIGDKGIFVNEVACRLGGAYEDVTIPYVTGIDVLKLNIEASIDDHAHFNGYTYRFEDKAFSTQLFFCKPGKIANMTPASVLKSEPYILDVGYNYRIGDTIGNIENASQRAGYFIVIGETEEEVSLNIKKAFELLTIQDALGKNLVVSFDEACNFHYGMTTL